MKKSNIFISTVAFRGKLIYEIIEIAKTHQLNIEFSSGLPYHHDMDNIFLKCPVNKLPHNYFPAPEVPFVLNLASTNTNIRKQSIEMCKKGITLAKEAGSLFYAAHAGFCIDPNPEELGRQLSVNVALDKNNHWDIFISSIKEILVHSERLQLPFIIENNVITEFNLTATLENPLFCCDSYELLKLNKVINNPLFGILLDTAHLKVSAKTLSLNLKDEFINLIPIVKAVHHSDNEGLKDSNNPFDEHYWCGRLLSRLNDIPHVIEVKDIEITQIKNQINLLQNFVQNESKN